MQDLSVAHSTHFVEDNITKIDHKRKKKNAAQTQQTNIQLHGLNAKQNLYLNLLRTAPQIIATGVAGTGKTFLPTMYAAQLLQQKKISKIVLCRPNVAAGRSLGFFPGSLEEKVAIWAVPFLELLSDALGATFLEYCLKRKVIEIVPFEVARGRTFSDAVIILDEAQNATIHELEMFFTRVGEGSQVVVCGDMNQSDLPNSGLKKAIQIAEAGGVEVALIDFTSEDIVRSGICASWVRAFEKHRKDSSK